MCNAKESVGNDLKMMEMRFLKIKLYKPFRYYFSIETIRKGYLFVHFPLRVHPRRHHKFPSLEKYRLFAVNLLYLKKLGAQGGPG